MQAVNYVRMFYNYFKEKYNWTTAQIDEEDFFLLNDLEFGQWKEELSELDIEPVMTIDEVRAMYR